MRFNDRDFPGEQIKPLSGSIHQAHSCNLELEAIWKEIFLQWTVNYWGSRRAIRVTKSNMVMKTACMMHTFLISSNFFFNLLVSFFFFVGKYFPVTCILARPWISWSLDCIRERGNEYFIYNTCNQWYQWALVSQDRWCNPCLPMVWTSVLWQSRRWPFHIPSDFRDALLIIVKYKNIQFIIQGQLLSINYPAQYTNGVWYEEQWKIHRVFSIGENCCLLKRVFKWWDILFTNKGKHRIKPVAYCFILIFLDHQDITIPSY